MPFATRRLGETRLRGAPLTLFIDGRTVDAHEGESVAAVLMAEGCVALRRSARLAEPRGLFCGMGACFECLVSVNGRPNVRACMTQVEGGMRVETADGVA